MSFRHFDSVIRPRMDTAGIKGGRAALRFYLPTVHAAAVAYRLEQAKPVDDDPMMAGSDSPELEKYRKVKRELGEIELAERRGQVVRVEVMMQGLRDGITALRGTGDRITREFGNEAGALYNEGVDEFEAAAERAIVRADELDEGDRLDP